MEVKIVMSKLGLTKKHNFIGERKKNRSHIISICILNSLTIRRKV